ncbi:MAG: AsmA-like C-terminal region-containing protein [Bacteroidia bacterium]|nr:AsmA-like C-terminal region-containing protein [Bacteroidia bacterium]
MNKGKRIGWKWKVGIGCLLLIGGAGKWGANYMIHFGLESLLSYMVGAAIRIEWVERLQWRGGTRWAVLLRNVHLGSTLPGDSSEVGFIEKVYLAGEKDRVDTIYLGKAHLHLVRLAKKQKNFRYFPRRGKKAKAHRFFIQADTLWITLANFPPQVHLQVGSSIAKASIEVDSEAVRVKQLDALLEVGEVCVKGKKWPFPRQVQFALTGTYEKETDTWTNLFLRLLGEGSKMDFQGEIRGWEKPYGVLHARIDTPLRTALAPSLSPWLLSRAVYLSASVRGWVYEAHAWGAWKEGEYEACFSGEKERIIALEGKVRWGSYAEIVGKGSLERFCMKGWMRRPSLSVLGFGQFSFPMRKGVCTLIVHGKDTIHLRGGWEKAEGAGTLGGISFQGRWEKEKIEIQLDSMDKDGLLRILSAYRPFFSQGVGFKGAVVLSCPRFRWDSTVVCEKVHVGIQEREMEASAFLQIPGFIDSVQVWLRTPLSFHRGCFSGKGSHLSLYADWRGDSVELSGVGRWNEVVVWGSGWGSFSGQRLWLRVLRVASPGQGEAILTGGLSRGGADVEVRGSLSLPWLWRFLPIPGMRVQEGELSVDFCAEGSWDTLLRWDNPTEGKAQLRGVVGYFPSVGLTLRGFSLDLRYTPEVTSLESLSFQVGEASVSARGRVEGTLSYLYTDWHRLRGSLEVEAKNFSLENFWRRVEGGKTRRQVRLPAQMEASITARLFDVDVYGLALSEAEVQARLQSGSLWIDTIGLRYGEAMVEGKGFMETSDSSCYMVAGRIKAEGLPLARLLRDMEVDTVQTLRKLTLSGSFSGEAQLSLRFTPFVEWSDQSSLWARGQIRQGRMKTPRFLRWFRPYYLATFRDSLDFLAEVPELWLKDGFLRITDALLLSRVAAIRITGYHYLPKDRFLYRIQGVRMLRRVQRYPYLEFLPLYIVDFLDRSIFLLYVEKMGERVHWRYPWRYLLRRFLWPRLAEPRPAWQKTPFSVPSSSVEGGAITPQD